MERKKKAEVGRKAPRRRRQIRWFQDSSFKVLKQVSPDTGITTDVMSQLSFFLYEFGKIISSRATSLSDTAGTKTVSARDVQAAVRLTYPGEMSKHAVAEGTKAVTKYLSSLGLKGGKSISRSSRAGLQFQVHRADRILRREAGRKRVSTVASVFLAAVLEYLAAELLELASNAARDNKRTRINSRQFQLAIKNDEELNKLFLKERLTVLGGGVLPNIHYQLLPKKKSKGEERY